tara:strand:- start:41605 stop:42309 length:705 start_codon:yes stop_codon:yes gene_type:complete
MENKGALVVLSGGQDSTTCLYWAKNKFENIHAVTFDYGQRHNIEVESARKIAMKADLCSWEVIDIPDILKGTSPLVNKSNVVGQYNSAEELPGGVEPTFIPARNILFLTLAANRATCLGIRDIITGVCQEDFGGYPDCRQIFIDKMKWALGEGINGDPEMFTIHTPLMNLTKKESVKMAVGLGLECIEALSYSHTCYNGEFPPCGKCHACILRQRGFDEAEVIDPLLERIKNAE